MYILLVCKKELLKNDYLKTLLITINQLIKIIIIIIIIIINVIIIIIIIDIIIIIIIVMINWDAGIFRHTETAMLCFTLVQFVLDFVCNFPALKGFFFHFQTRVSDWREGALDSRHFINKLCEADAQLKQYEESAAPPGWTCHWDRYCISLVLCPGG